MPRPAAPRYWALQPVLFPWDYRMRTALTDCYTLQVSGREGGRRHRATLYCLTLVGKLRPVWSRSFALDGDTSVDAAQAMALYLLRHMLRTDKAHLKKINAVSSVEADLERAVEIAVGGLPARREKERN